MKCVHHSIRRLIPAQDGMTLIEVSFAAGVLALALAMLFGSLISLTVIGRLNEDRAIAEVELSTVIDHAARLPLEELVVYQPPSPARPGVKRSVSLVCFDHEGQPVNLPLPHGPGETPEIPELPNPLELQATLLWSAPSGHVFRSAASTMVAY